MKPKKLLVLSSLPFLCSCSFVQTSTFSWDAYKNSTVSMSLQSSKFEKYSLKTFDNEINDLKSKLNKAISEGNLNLFITYYNNLYEYFDEVVDSYIIASTKYYANSKMNEYKTKSDKYFDQYNSLRQYFIALEEDIYKCVNQEIRREYFGSMTDKQIEERLSGNEELLVVTEYQEYFKEYQEDGELLYNNYRNGTISKSEFLDQGTDAFLSYINKANEFIDKVDYSNYLEYAYEVEHERDFSYTDSAAFVNYVKQYLVPIYKDCDEIDAPDNIDTSIITALNSYNFCNTKTDSADLLSSYAEDLGGQYLTAYNNAWKYGYYCFSDSANSLSTAYQWNLQGSNDSVLYFSRNYQKILTIVHEFGHYYGSNANSGAHKYDSTDMSETYSQGNEFTYLNYVLTKKENTPEYDTYRYFVDDYAYSNLFYIIQEAAITEIENFAYTTAGLTKETLSQGINSILNSYDGTLSETYYLAPLICSPCYYISYATSVIQALQFIATDYQSAKTMYTKLVENQSGNTLVQKWKSAGLGSPFEEDSIKNVAQALTEIKDRYK